MKTIIWICILSLAAIRAYGNIVVNEIMYAPAGDEPEWIEIYNNSGDDLQMQNATLSDLSLTKSIPAFVLPAYSYAIFTKDLTNLSKIRQIPANSQVIEFTLPSLNNTFDAVVIKLKGVKEDSVYYSASWGKPGVSLERKSITAASLNQSNWAASIDKSGATCGWENSVSEKPYNLKISNFNYDKASKTISAMIENLGSSDNFEVNYSLFIDLNKDKLFDGSELVINGVASADSNIMVEFPYDTLQKFISSTGNYDLVLEATSGIGLEQSIDSASLNVFLRNPADLFTFNELMFDPNKGSSEYIEIFYNGTDSVSRSGWTLYDESLLGKKGAIFTSGYFKPGSYTTVFFDSTFFDTFPELYGNTDAVYIKSSLSLNNSDDRIFLADPNGDFADSCNYSSGWQDTDIENTTGRSLEKFNPEMLSSNSNSWSTCTDIAGGTPCRENSLSRPVSSDVEINADPNPFSPYSQAKDKSTLISGKSRYLKSRLNLKIYDLAGNIVKTIATNDYTGTEFAYVWDGRDDKGFILPAGAYVVLVESYDTGSNESAASKIMIAIGN